MCQVSAATVLYIFFSASRENIFRKCAVNCLWLLSGNAELKQGFIIPAVQKKIMTPIFLNMFMREALGKNMAS